MAADIKRRMSIKLITCSLILVQFVLLLCEESYGQETGEKPKLFCGDRDLGISRLKHLNNDQVSTDECPVRVAEAFNALVGVINDRDDCTMDTVTRLTQFCDTYHDDQQVARLVRFAYAYGAQLCNDYKLQLMKLHQFAGRSLDKNDYAELEPWITDDGPIARLLDPINHDNMRPEFMFLLHSDLSAQRPDYDSNTRLVVQAVSDSNSKRLTIAKQACECRFMPIYKKIIMPIVHLARNGLCGLESRLTRIELKMIRKKVRLWSRIVFLCETLKQVKLVEPVVAAPGLAVVDVDVIDYEDSEEKDEEEETSSCSGETETYYNPRVKINENKLTTYVKLLSSSGELTTSPDITVRKSHPIITWKSYSQHKIVIGVRRLERLVENMIPLVGALKLAKPNQAERLISEAAEIAWRSVDSSSKEEEEEDDVNVYSGEVKQALLELGSAEQAQEDFERISAMFGWQITGRSRSLPATIRLGRGLQYMIVILLILAGIK